jgi:hypothetical protein
MKLLSGLVNVLAASMTIEVSLARNDTGCDVMFVEPHESQLASFLNMSK